MKFFVKPTRMETKIFSTCGLIQVILCPVKR